MTNTNLAIGTRLGDRYMLEQRLITSDIHVCTYQARDEGSGLEVHMHEYFPSTLVQRAADGHTVQVSGSTADDFRFGLELFRDESRRLKALNHPNLEPVVELLEENGTIYRITTLPPGATLEHALDRRGGPISEAAARKIFLPIIEGLATAHERGVVHGGISAASVHLARDRTARLVGFRGASLRLARLLGCAVEMSLPGSSPIEQFEAGAEHGSAGDVYALAATLFEVTTGERLPDAPVRVPSDPIPCLIGGAPLSAGMREVLKHALALRAADRPRNAGALRGMLADADLSLTGGRGGHVVKPPTSTPNLRGHNEAADRARTGAPAGERHGRTDGAETRLDILSHAGPPKLPAVQNISGERDVRSSEEQKEGGLASPVPDGITPYPDEDDDGSPADVSARWRRRGTLLVGIGGGIILILVVGLFSVLYGEGWTGDHAGELDSFLVLTAEGDSLMARENYTAARARFSQATEMPQASEEGWAHFLDRRLEEVSRRESAHRAERYRHLLNEARSYQIRAGEMQEAGRYDEALSQYEAARDAYLGAWDLSPSDSLAYDLAEGIQQEIYRLSSGSLQEGATGRQEEALREADERLYTFYRNEGDRLMNDGQSHQARASFQQALAHRPGDAYVQNQLQRIAGQSGETERDEQFAAQLAEAEALFQQRDLSAAREAFEEARTYGIDDPRIENRLARIDSQLSAQAGVEQQYQNYRDRADRLFNDERFAEAIFYYRQAASSRPGDQYVTRRLQEAEQLLASPQPEERPQPGRQREDGVYIITDREPQLIDSLEELHRQVNYPRAAVRSGIEGRVIMQLVVEKDGSVGEATVLRGIGGGCDEEALRVMRGAQFHPALVDGEPVRAQHSAWIRFRLD